MNSRNDLPKYEFEGFRLTYEHFMDVNGDKFSLEEPIVAQCYVDRNLTLSVKPYVLNEILERMKEEIYKRVLKKDVEE